MPNKSESRLAKLADFLVGWEAVWYTYKRDEAEDPGAGGKQEQL